MSVSECNALVELLASTRSLATPFLWIDGRTIERNVRRLRQVFPGVEISYALKCNATPEVVDALRRLDVGFEVASSTEVEQLMRAKVATDRMVCMHPVKSPAFLRQLHDVGVRVLAVDCREEVDKIAECAPQSRVVVRIKLPKGKSRVPLNDKFGCAPEESLALLRHIRSQGLFPAGITLHVGSQCESEATWCDALTLCGELCDAWSRDGQRVNIVSLGGGLPAPYQPSVLGLETISQILTRALSGNSGFSDCRVTMEPGRAVVASAGSLVASVIGVATRGQTRWVYLDAGVYHGLFECLPVAGGFTPPMAVEHPDRPCHRYRLGGPTCDSLDALPGTYLLPELSVGDRVAFGCAGGYSTVMATQFNGFPPPRTVFQRNGGTIG